ncbi:hypothetical protein EVAR_10134_1 [Eumeta japonica]|uniref:Reverse transcriptase domain-containing protein n=1 Tax=Eumeta variegata TaxID=151549 RepID=A0A4C1UC24_EUMVA|nr:hypothetical protein EVAR_10134_1 [Eumeta japonica]
MDDLSVKCLLYTDDQVILAPSACGLQEMVTKVNDFVKKRGILVNVGKAKVMVFERGESMTECDKLRTSNKGENISERRSLRVEGEQATETSLTGRNKTAKRLFHVRAATELAIT